MEKQHIVSASDFKTHCLEYLEATKTTHAQYVVTKRGKPIAKLVPIQEESGHFVFGGMADTMTIHGDIMAPVDVTWDVDDDVD